MRGSKGSKGGVCTRLLEARVCEQQRQVLLEGGAWLGPGLGLGLGLGSGLGLGLVLG